MNSTAAPIRPRQTTRKTTACANCSTGAREIASVFANDACHLAYPYETLLQGYQRLLTNQFHDILPGSSIHQVYEDCAKDYAWIQNNGTAILNTALAALEAQIPHGEGDILVWNFLSWPRSQCVSVCLKDTPLSSASAVTAFNAAGKAMKSSFAPASGVLTFLAEDVPAMGYALFSLRACAPEASPQRVCQPERPGKPLLQNSVG